MTCRVCGRRTQYRLCQECRLERDHEFYQQRAEEWAEADDE